MLTLFTTPKAFRGHIAVIQRNAITSWTRLEPRPQVLVIGNEEGAAEISRELGLQHIPNLESNEFGAPLLRDLFSKAEQASCHDVLCYVNADLILLSDFPRAVERALSAAPKFLMVGRRWDVAMDRLCDFTAPEWAARLRQYVREAGAQAPPPGNSDYFCFSRGLWDSMPPLAIGRAAWDAWLIYEARRLHAGVVDASAAVMAVHQKHDQTSYPHGLRRWRAELSRNYEIAGAEAARFCLYDATHVLTAEALARPHGLPYFIRHFDTLPLFYPRLAAPLHIPRLAIAGVRRLRRELTLARGPLYRLTRLILSRLPENGITSVLGLGDAGAGNGTEGLGLRLAHGLLWSGFPVVVYDGESAAVEEARRRLGGPVEFAASAEACAEQGDVLVVTLPKEEFRAPARQFLERADSSGSVIDCCGLLSANEPPRGVRYVSWEEK